MNFRLGAIAGLLACLAGCQVWNAAFAPTALREAYFAQSVPMRHIFRAGSLFPDASDLQATFRSQSDVDAFISKFPMNRFNEGGRYAALPPVDFAKEMGILVIGKLNGNVTALEIASVEEQADRFYVRAVHFVPAPDEIRLPMVTVPCHYIAVPRSEKPVVFAPIVETTQGSLRPADTPPSDEPFPSVFVPHTPKPYPNASPSNSTTPPSTVPSP